MSWAKCVWVVVVVATVSGCELWLHVDGAQCDKDQTCVGLFGHGYTCGHGVCSAPAEATDAGETKPTKPPRWQCLDAPAKTFVPDPDKLVTVRMDVIDVATLRVPSGVNATACSPADVNCIEPVITGAEPGSDGFFEFNLPYGFEGFFEFKAPNMAPALLFRSKAYIESVTTSGPALASVATLMDIGKAAGHPIDPETGVAILEIRDCFDAAGDGVQFDSVSGEEPFYFQGALPARDLQGTTLSYLLAANREPRAVGGFSNLPPGYLTFQARLVGTQDLVGKITLQIRAGYITYVRIYPGS